MNQEIKIIKNIIKNNQGKRVLILGTIGSDINRIGYKLGEVYDNVFYKTFKSEYGVDANFYCLNKEEINKIKEKIKVKKNIPMFSNIILECDLIIYIHINKDVLKIKTLYNEVDYEKSLNYQKELENKLNNMSTKIIKIESIPNTINLNKIPRNVYICCDLKLDEIPYSKTKNEFYDNNSYESIIRFPYIKMIKSINEIRRKQGFLLIIDEKYLEDNIINIDIKYRHLFNNFIYVWIVTKDKNKLVKKHLKYSNIYFVDRFSFANSGIDGQLLSIYYDYIMNVDIKINNKNMEKLKEYIKGKKRITSMSIAKHFGISIRQAERYLKNYNLIYKNIGYDFLKNEWYITNTKS